MRSVAAMMLSMSLLIGCGGGGPPVELTIDSAPTLTTALDSVVLSGQTFIPAGSDCPSSNEFIIIGTLGPATITVRNAATGTTVPGALTWIWVCNAGSDTIDWYSNPVTLVTGANVITVTMSDGRRSSTATITVNRT